jgi:hypothetical protein
MVSNPGYIYIMLTLPRNLIGSTANVKTGSKLLKYRCWETLGEDVGILGCRGCWEYALEIIIEMIVLSCIHDILSPLNIH